MYIYTINSDIKEKMISHGAKLMNEMTDINGKRVWCLTAPNSFAFDIDTLPKDQVVIRGSMKMNF